MNTFDVYLKGEKKHLFNIIDIWPKKTLCAPDRNLIKKSKYQLIRTKI